MNDIITMKLNVDNLLMQALREDVTNEDITTNAVIPVDRKGEAQLLCKQDGIVAGLDIFGRVFVLLDETAEFETRFKDGDEIHKGDLIGTIRGNLRAILTGERTALNYLQRMSGIATYTKKMADLLKGSNTRLLNTRKTTPNMRIFETYAVRMGGALNHRYNLSDGILIKDNHISGAGGVKKAVELAREYAPFVRKIEVEAETLEMVEEALEAGADIIMLDNMDVSTMKAAVKRIAGRATTECSGNVTMENAAGIAEAGVDYISSGAVTHSAGILDLSLKNLREI
ncbi:carboxylating nicotinate-nucleotide diphosphorylase [Parasporobacterium paucivorans]|uniref:Probable nicotinate-nucleotide pyrophosphorylase [carboxylating] n=1 Tax=Parasporobacterium paucivorans DSM 15970 TaxID=1122934 RepID=A0A1M6D5N2_9FIRM|nr:carboxylating nicotinate-nucleotide diphosphorylase [Parasporobacterium paucivorans]SHI68338.1 nicotinate-nucleotide pyrophosphorylase [carboxylating] [Parasporobacterium paucivorans DSM 15970]